MFICDTCNREFQKKSKLNRHKRETHENIKQYVCEVCNKQFKRNSHLKRHLIGHSDNPKPHKCEYDNCFMSFTCKHHLERHVKIIHGDEFKIKCEHCELIFTKKSNYNKHLTYTHGEKKPFECSKCEKSFFKCGQLEKHEKKHADKEYVDQNLDDLVQIKHNDNIYPFSMDFKVENSTPMNQVPVHYAPMTKQEPIHHPHSPQFHSGLNGDQMHQSILDGNDHNINHHNHNHHHGNITHDQQNMDGNQHYNSQQLFENHYYNLSNEEVMGKQQNRGLNSSNNLLASKVYEMIPNEIHYNQPIPKMAQQQQQQGHALHLNYVEPTIQLSPLKQGFKRMYKHSEDIFLSDNEGDEKRKKESLDLINHLDNLQQGKLHEDSIFPYNSNNNNNHIDQNQTVYSHHASSYNQEINNNNICNNNNSDQLNISNTNNMSIQNHHHNNRSIQNGSINVNLAHTGHSSYYPTMCDDSNNNNNNSQGHSQILNHHSQQSPHYQQQLQQHQQQQQQCEQQQHQTHQQQQQHNHQQPMIAQNIKPRDDQKMFICSFQNCHKMYSKLANLKVHIRAFHLKSRDFVCHFSSCKSSFLHKKSLKEHLQKVHQIDIKNNNHPQNYKDQYKNNQPIKQIKKLSVEGEGPENKSDNTDVLFNNYMKNNEDIAMSPNKQQKSNHHRRRRKRSHHFRKRSFRFSGSIDIKDELNPFKTEDTPKQDQCQSPTIQHFDQDIIVKENEDENELENNLLSSILDNISQEVKQTNVGSDSNKIEANISNKENTYDQLNLISNIDDPFRNDEEIKPKQDTRIESNIENNNMGQKAHNNNNNSNNNNNNNDTNQIQVPDFNNLQQNTSSSNNNNYQFSCSQQYHYQHQFSEDSNVQEVSHTYGNELLFN